MDINGGSINDTAIGENIKSTGAFTTLSTSEILDAGGPIKAHSGLTVLNGDLDVKNRIINDYLVSTDTNQVISGIKTFNEEIVGDLIGDVTGDVTGNLTGDVTGNLTGDVTGNVSGSSGSCTGNSATTTKINSIENNNIMLKDANETISGIKTFNEEIVGDLLGDVTGDITGNLTGDVTGNLTGDVTGNVSGSSGSCTGNAATATRIDTIENTNIMLKDANETISGIKTFNEEIVGDLIGDVTGNLTGDVTGNIDLNSGIIRHTHSTEISNSTTDVTVDYASYTNQTNKHKLTFNIDANNQISTGKEFTVTISNIVGVTADSVIYASSEQAVIITPHSVGVEAFQLKIEAMANITSNTLSINFVIF